ncbi:MAG: potassium channel family protein, partial [Egibacteraceae bacterium]
DGHDVVVVDKSPGAFRRLDHGFGGRALTGIVFDRQTLEEAGIKRAQAFVAVTSGDNSNIVCARIAKERYGVEHVVARIYDAERATIYERLGITTVASARWTAEAVLREISPAGDRVEGSVGSGAGDVVLVELTVPDGIHGADATRLSVPGKAVLVAITREGSTHLPVEHALLEAHDQLHIAVRADEADVARELLEALVEEVS